jgi:branched-chain amino acid transport system ATP-binding protein
MTYLLDARNLSVVYDKAPALRDVSISLEPGEIVALIGANGAGKSTTLRAITGLKRPRSGEVWFNGERIDGLAPPQIVERGVVMVPEGRHVYPFMSIKDNLLMGAYLRRDSSGVRDDLDRIFVRFPRLKERFRQQAGTLSGGEQEMLVVGRALMARPKLLLLDEPSLGLAPLMIAEIARLVVAINREDKVGVVLVEQNSRLALKISHRAYVLETGSVSLSGPAQDLLGDDAIRKAYLGG